MEGCTHVGEARGVTPRAEGCEECLAAGDRWVELRLCLGCGHVGCCNSSKNRHASKHFHETGHPLVRSFRTRQDWVWCFVDEAYLDPAVLPGDAARSSPG